MWYKFFPQASEDAKESSLLEQTLEPDNTLLSVFPHESQDERYITKLWKIMFLHGTKLICFNLLEHKSNTK